MIESCSSPHLLATVGVCIVIGDLGFANNRLTLSASVTCSSWMSSSLARFPDKLDLMSVIMGFSMTSVG